MVSNIDIFQGIVSKLEIPVSWQHYHTRVQMEMTASLIYRGSTHTQTRSQSIHSVFTAGRSDGLKGGWLVKRWHMMNWRPLSPHLPSSAPWLHHRQAWCHPASTTRNNDWCGIFNQKAGHCYWMNHISCVAANSWNTISGEDRFNMGRFLGWWPIYFVNTHSCCDLLVNVTPKNKNR